MSGFAIKYPFLIIVICLMIAIVGTVTVARMPVDLFPPINIPVVVVATFYSGMPPSKSKRTSPTSLRDFLLWQAEWTTLSRARCPA